MQPSHVINFVDFKLAQYLPRYIASKSKFDSMLEIYKSASWFKKFVTDNPHDSDWEHWWVGSWIEQLKEIKREAEYKHKMDYMRMDIPEDWQKHFYKWANENKIPF
jgi:hypothetical protein